MNDPVLKLDILLPNSESASNFEKIFEKFNNFRNLVKSCYCKFATLATSNFLIKNV